ncbi:MAG: hypothetical protein Q7S22_01970 [Candidatus Micrarchaeota archaeon]|nr:hypothetical protein [Candidatus Micrarchaeota archaeon]
MVTTQAVSRPTSNGNVGAKPKTTFRSALLEEVPHLTRIYDSSWCKPEKLRKTGHSDRSIDQAMDKLAIAEWQLAAQMKNFSEGQIVASLDGSSSAAGMINTLVRLIGDVSHIPRYVPLTGDRTFKTHVRIEDVSRIARETAQIPVIFCVSIVVDPTTQGSGVALSILHHAISVGESNGFYVVPYSAPRDLAEFAFLYPEHKFTVVDYLSYTRSSKRSYLEYYARLLAFNNGRGKLFYKNPLEPSSQSNYELDNDPNENTDSMKLAFARFKYLYERRFNLKEGRGITVEDYILMTGRSHVDSVLDMHIRNGARFLRDSSGSITVRYNSRLGDLQAQEINVPLAYTPHPLLLGPGFEWVKTLD